MRSAPRRDPRDHGGAAAGAECNLETSKYEVERADKQPAVAPVAYSGKLVGLALAKEHGCALDDGGKVQCWKMTATAVTNAAAVDGLDQVTHIEGGEEVVAVRRDGSAFELDCKAEPCTAHKVASGDLVQALRQLTECVGVTKRGGAVLWIMAGPKAGVLEPIAGLSAVEALAHGGYRTCALSKTHEVSCFARGEAPTAVGLEHVKALSGGGDYVTALLEDGSFVTWKPKDGKPSRSYQ